MEIFQPSGNMVVDIGGGTTDIAVLSMGDIVTSSSIKMAGDKFDMEILNYIKRKYKLLIGERTSEDIKIKVGTVFPGARSEELEIRGRDMVTGLPRTITVCSEEITEALKENAAVIVQAAKRRTRAHTTRTISGHHRPRCDSNRRWSFTTRYRHASSRRTKSTSINC